MSSVGLTPFIVTDPHFSAERSQKICALLKWAAILLFLPQQSFYFSKPVALCPPPLADFPFPTCAVFLLFFLPLLAFYGILRAATLECIVATKAISSSGLRRTSDGGWSSKAAAWNCVPNQSSLQSTCHLSSICGESCSLVSQKQHLKLCFPHYFVACLFFPAVCLSIHSTQRECSHCAEGPIWNSAAELLLSFSMEKALQTSLVVNARHMQEQHF